MNSRQSKSSRSTQQILRALVTGSSGGIGEATARRLAANGIAVAVHGRQEQNVRRIVSEIEKDGGRAVAIIGDLAAEGMPTAVAEQAFAALGGMDLVVNNAGQLLFGAFEEASLTEIKQVFDVNLFAVMAITNALLPGMRRQAYGRIINVSSVVGWLPFAFMGAYAASKHALEGYSESLDHEVRSFGIRVSTVQPGFTRTQINVNAAIVQHTVPDYDVVRRRIIKLIEKKIQGGISPDRVARTIVRAAMDRSPRSHYLVGIGPTALRALRFVVPAKLFAMAFRKQFQLDDSI